MVRQQGLDVANALSACYQRTNPDTNWIILIMMGDDFMPCENARTGLMHTHTLDPLETKFAGFTQGSGGVAFSVDNVMLYVQSKLDNIGTTPYDGVLRLPWSPKADFVFTKHFFRHVGNVSTIGYRNNAECDTQYVRQYSGLRDNKCGDEIRVERGFLYCGLIM